MRSDSLDRRYGINDLVKNKGVNLALMVILVLSAFLMATGSMVMERLVGSVNALFEQAKPPHFLQMHVGEYDRAALDQFAAQHPEITSWTIEEMVGFDSSAIAWSRPATGASGDLSRSLIDNLFVMQNRDFDHLVGLEGDIPQPTPGTVYVPVAYQQQFGLMSGDRLSIRAQDGIVTLDVAGFVRDGQMASSLSSATRFVVSEQDFKTLLAQGGGDPEIIVAYLLTDESLTGDLERAYDADQAVPKNGQAVTFQAIRLINAFSDGLVAIALVFISLLLITIALLNLRFVIRGSIEDDVREIGVMKAIGLPEKTISGLYLTKYTLMTLVACLIGGVAAIFATNALTQSIQTNYAAAPVGPLTFVVPLIALVVVAAIVIFLCRGVLRSLRRIQVVNALVHGSTLDEKQTAKQARRAARRARGTSLTRGRGNLNRRLAWLDLRADGGQWALIPLVFFLVSILMTLPMNLLSTFESPRFVTYMGAPESDLRADLQFSENVDQVRRDLLSAMQADERLTDIRAYAGVLHEAQGKEGWESFRVEVGDYTGATVSFAEGTAPAAGEIAVSALNASKYGLSTGDHLTLRQAGRETTLRVSGVYQDVTSGGYTAKMQGEVTSGATSYVLYANVTPGADPAAIAREYDARHQGSSVIPMREYVQQTLSYVTDAFRAAALLSLVFGVGVAALITSLFLKLRLTRERPRMGVLSAIGFSAREIIAQIRFKTIVSVALGTMLGMAFAATAGEALVGALISVANLGITRLTFISNPLLVWVAYPLILITAGYLGAVALTAGLRRADKSSWLKG